jgi:uncharacterized membrane protein
LRTKTTEFRFYCIFEKRLRQMAVFYATQVTIPQMRV